VKLEMFIFDPFATAERTALFEVRRAACGLLWAPALLGHARRAG
jgi:hypothetical protein